MDITGIGGAIGKGMEAVNGIIGKFVTNDKERLEAQAAVLSVQNHLTESVLNAHSEVVNAQKSVLMTEMTSGSVLARNVRPFGLLIFILVVAWNFVSKTFGYPVIELTPEFWYAFMLYSGGYISGRSIDKAVSGSRFAPPEAKQAKQDRKMLRLREKAARAAAKAGISLNGILDTKS